VNANGLNTVKGTYTEVYNKEKCILSLPVKLAVVVPPHLLPHPCLGVVVVKPPNVVGAPMLAKASRPFGLTDEDGLPKVLASGIPC
jgi:hypothetical protein